ncbi:unnamed protein product [Brassica rapa]|uniref:Uncharacterized protein n=1 Tax=Brassica campestris TaxID=3711 RepID=A0A8D9GCI1_BRACM|nr:unnamed protein product [Brassica rapa]
MFVYLLRDLQPATERRLLFVLLSRNLRPGIGRMSQRLKIKKNLIARLVAGCRSQVARHVNEHSFSRRSQV